MNLLKLKFFLNIVLGTITTIAVLTIITMVFPFFKGYSPYTVLSNSMGKTMECGSIVYVKQVKFDEIKTGDIATFKSAKNSNKFFTHRVVGIDKLNKTFVTRGDANPNNDPLPTKSEQLVGRVVSIIPFAGIPAAAMQNKLILVITLLLLILWVATEIEINRMKRKGKDTE